MTRAERRLYDHSALAILLARCGSAGRSTQEVPCRWLLHLPTNELVEQLGVKPLPDGALQAGADARLVSERVRDARCDRTSGWSSLAIRCSGWSIAHGALPAVSRPPAKATSRGCAQTSCAGRTLAARGHSTGPRRAHHPGPWRRSGRRPRRASGTWRAPWRRSSARSSCGQGYRAARTFVLRLLRPELQLIRTEGSQLDAKSTLQHLVQARWHEPPEYVTVDEETGGAGRRFTVEVRVAGRRSAAVRGVSKREAQQRAAQRGGRLRLSAAPGRGLAGVPEEAVDPGLQELRESDDVRVRARRHGVVGPNGSGQEQRLATPSAGCSASRATRLLRAKKQEDVIFAGTGERAAVGMAEVGAHARQRRALAAARLRGSRDRAPRLPQRRLGVPAERLPGPAARRRRPADEGRRWAEQLLDHGPGAGRRSPEHDAGRATRVPRRSGGREAVPDEDQGGAGPAGGNAGEPGQGDGSSWPRSSRGSRSFRGRPSGRRSTHGSRRNCRTC